KQIIKDIFSKHSPYESLLSIMSVTELMKYLKEYEDIYWYKSYQPAKVEDFKKSALKLVKMKTTEAMGWLKRAQENVDGEKWSEYFIKIEEFLSKLEKIAQWEECLECIHAYADSFKMPVKSKNTPALGKG